MDLAIGPNDTLYAAAGPAGLFRSTDDGDTWRLANTPAELASVTRVSAAATAKLVEGVGPRGE